jgi:hypothetical protein
VKQGDKDVGPGELMATIMLVKPSGNLNLPYSNIANIADLTIDAHAPVISKMEVPSIEVGVGGMVQVTVTADGAGYTAVAGTVVNGIPLSSPRVTFSERSPGLYEIAYTVASGDSDVSPGELQVTVVISDPAGNLSSSYTIMAPNTLEVYTALPEALLAGTPEICEGESAELSVFFVGRGPWSFELSDGVSTRSFEDISESNYVFTVTPAVSSTYRILTVTDVNGVINTGTGVVSVEVVEKTFVEIINLASGYSVESEPVKLEANIPGGTFSGPGVISATGYFHPDLADTTNSPHTIYYTYTNVNGCVSVDSALVLVLGGEGVIYIPSEVTCANGEPFTVTAANLAGTTGSFRLLNSSSQSVEGIVDQGDNTAIISPSLLVPGIYTIEYKYFDEVERFLREDFEVEEIAAPVIVNLSEDSYCQGIEPFRLQANVGNAVFEGPGVSYSIIGYMFDPQDVEPGEITIKCSVTSEHGCVAFTEQTVWINFGPDVLFTIENACIPDEGGVIVFGNLTPNKLLMDSWNWDFGDPESGQDNSSNLTNPEHFYATSGVKRISLTATTTEGCTGSMVIDTLIGNLPLADFALISDCYISNQEIRFLDRTQSMNSEVDRLVWKFMNPGGGELGTAESSSSSDTVSFEFSEAGSYLVELISNNTHGCSDTVTKEIVLSKTISLASGKYLESFNSSEGLWTVHSENELESWVWDVPDFTGFTPVPGNRAWFTQLPESIIDYRENSWVQSPCFNFTGIENPFIELDLMRSFVPDLDGAVLQYQDVLEEGWKLVGDATSGMNWYNSSDIQYEPGGSSSGWTLLDVFNPDKQWVSAAHDLDVLAGNTIAKFRIAITTSGAEGTGNQGFAFDNIAINQRSQRTVLEYFTNSSDINSRSADDEVDAILTKSASGTIDLQYHMDYPGTDPMNINNPDPASSRAFYYGVPQVPYAILQGGVESDQRYTFDEIKAENIEEDVREISLGEPQFEVELEVTWTATGLDATTTVTCKVNSFIEFIQLYLVVFEKEVTAYTGGNGDSNFKNVVLDMLPTPAGKLLGDNWYNGKSDVRTNSWTYASFVEDLEDLGIAAFIQERSTGRILQAAVNYASGGPVSIGNGKEWGEILTTYPNPARDLLFVNIGERSGKDGVIELIDMSGQVVLNLEVPAGYQVIQLNIDYLNPGFYLVRWIESDQLRGYSKIIKAR